MVASFIPPLQLVLTQSLSSWRTTRFSRCLSKNDDPCRALSSDLGIGHIWGGFVAVWTTSTSAYGRSPSCGVSLPVVKGIGQNSNPSWFFCPFL
ncbi:hypothetical protein CC2G_012820 [Coprinopsis cinerea AmutBmut pab1-1]|nr:hypothetical protein CC2G_012820 [Coprinopsis cinerea AmutBmut pab1-1]